ncbi:hypothetical protein CK203_033406 [Vitis vinifera]|uniref:RING-type domain-containing protein n=1 Tax=Vitis vinifera TaxID=29760 RepID=A0A438HMY8_VITVI|nr:hypothetical protein CK203_033406 [Vitis vinifera]
MIEIEADPTPTDVINTSYSHSCLPPTTPLICPGSCSIFFQVIQPLSVVGIFCVAIKMPKSINVVFLLNLLGYFKVIVMVALAHLGLFHPPEQAYSEEHPASTYVVVMDGQTPSLVPVPVVMAWIKKRVPVVEYGSFLGKLGMHEDEDAVCSVCLDCIKRSHQIRELSNCCHVFHKECLDTWVDEGQALSLPNGTKAIYLDDDSAIISGDWDLEWRMSLSFISLSTDPILCQAYFPFCFLTLYLE